MNFSALALIVKPFGILGEKILASFLQARTERRKADCTLYNEIIHFIPYDFIDEFCNSLILKRGYGREASSRLNEYIQFSKRGDKVFLDRGLQKKYRAMNELLDNLLTRIALKFFASQADPNYYLYFEKERGKRPPEREKAYYKGLQELEEATRKFENAYDEFIKISGRRLYI